MPSATLPNGMSREEVIAIVLSTAIVGCGGSVAGKTGVGDQGDGSVGGVGGTSGSPTNRGAGGSISLGGTAGSSGLVACNDGAGSTDCCPASAADGASCDGTVSQCSGGCHSGYKSYLYCGADGTWIAGHALFLCGRDAGVPPGSVDAGLPNPVFCQPAGGQCLIGGSSCSKVIGSVNCNPAQTGPGSFCCLDPPPECTDANVQMIQASNYDQWCNTNSDCIAVGEGNACYTCLISCANAAINVRAKSQYDADVEKTLAGRLAGAPICGCPMSSGPCCVGGVCRADIQCSMSAP